MAFTLKLDGLEETLKKLDKMDDEVKADVDDEIGASVFEMRNLAVSRVRVDKGMLKNSIQAEKVKDMVWTMESRMPYSAYLNWGTVNRVKVEKEWAAYAILFKGKGIRKSGGIKPTFFFTGAVEEVKPKMIERLKKLINK